MTTLRLARHGALASALFAVSVLVSAAACAPTRAPDPLDGPKAGDMAAVAAAFDGYYVQDVPAPARVYRVDQLKTYEIVTYLDASPEPVANGELELSGDKAAVWSSGRIDVDVKVKAKSRELPTVVEMLKDGNLSMTSHLSATGSVTVTLKRISEAQAMDLCLHYPVRKAQDYKFAKGACAAESKSAITQAIVAAAETQAKDCQTSLEVLLAARVAAGKKDASLCEVAEDVLERGVAYASGDLSSIEPLPLKLELAAGADLKTIAELELGAIELKGKDVTSVADLLPLAAGLRSLSISETGVADLGVIQKLARLEALDLGNAPIPRNELYRLSALDHLKDLTVRAEPADLALLKDLALSRLDLTITGAGRLDLGSLARMKALDTLKLAGQVAATEDVEIADLASIVTLPKLHELSLGSLKILDVSALEALLAKAPTAGISLFKLKLPSSQKAIIEAALKSSPKNVTTADLSYVD